MKLSGTGLMPLVVFMGVEVGGEWEEGSRGRNSHRGIQTDGLEEKVMLLRVEHPGV